jgi:predicted HAD superfamily Cof-like phosphohydrolase
MGNPFEDQESFMVSCDQSVYTYNQNQFDLYVNLIREELQELNEGIDNEDNVEKLDALVDILVVTIGAIYSMGADAQRAWNEVMRTNFAKVDAQTGKVRKREDGKVLKPENWQPPNLRPFITKAV